MTLTWKHGGVLLGLVFFLGVWLAKPVGISTEYVVFSGMLWDALQPGLVDGATSTNAYLAANKGSVAQAISSPLTNYGVWFALATVAGGLISHTLRRLRKGPALDPYSRHPLPAASDDPGDVPATWRARFGDSTLVRALGAFGGGVLVLYGARLADGCTSGHMMSGMMQTSVSGYLFALGAFGAAVPLAYALYRKAV